MVPHYVQRDLGLTFVLALDFDFSSVVPGFTYAVSTTSILISVLRSSLHKSLGVPSVISREQHISSGDVDQLGVPEICIFNGSVSELLFELGLGGASLYELDPGFSQFILTTLQSISGNFSASSFFERSVIESVVCDMVKENV